MQVSHREHIVQVEILALTGRLDAFNVRVLRDTQDKLLGNGGKYFVVDLSDVTFMDSAGLSGLVSLLKRARQAGGEAVLVSPTEPAAYRILTLTSFDRVFKLVNSVDAGIKVVQG